MRREIFTRRSLLLLLVTVTVTCLFLSRDTWNESHVTHGTSIESHVSEMKRSLVCKRTTCSALHKEGKQVIYKALTDCALPQFLNDRQNPCWNSTSNGNNIVCSAKIVLLGFHKSGTTDVSRWFKKICSYTTSDYFISNQKLTRQCPDKWLEEFRIRRRLPEDSNITSYDDCPGCAIVSRVIQANATYVIRQSAIQYLQYTMRDNSRYIVTMRDPVDRMISHFFYVHKIQRDDNPYTNLTLQEVGNAFFHRLVSETVSSLTRCLILHGTTVCVLEPDLSPLDHPNPYLLSMMTIGCYSTHLKEVFKFIPKELIYFSKLDEYSTDEAKSIKKMYKFVGIPITSYNNPAKSVQRHVIRNAGYEKKPILLETKEALRTFYQPFNTELAQILGDNKWLWQ